jgi:steroid delta-isomerase-like uncharacterized protein
MSVEENKALMRRLYEEIHNKGNMAVADELVAADFVDHNAPSPDIPPGPEGVKQIFTMLRSAFPDFHVTVEDMLAEEDKVMARVTVHGTHKGEFIGIAPTGKLITMPVVDIVRIAGGKIVERWGVEDNLSMMQQLGIIPPPGQPGR